MAWVPIESNPDVMNKYILNLGVSPKYEMIDIYSLDPDSLASIPRPVLAVILLFPSTDKYKQFRENQEKEIKEKGQDISKNVYYLKQTVRNACGVIALIHSLANNVDAIQLGDGPLKTFLDETKDLSPEDRGEMLKKAEGIINVHNALAQEGQTEAPDANDRVSDHFLSFICKDNHLYELDGSKSFPINHGSTSNETFLEDAAKICKMYIERDPDELHFTIVALVSNYG